MHCSRVDPNSSMTSSERMSRGAGSSITVEIGLVDWEQQCAEWGIGGRPV